MVSFTTAAVLLAASAATMVSAQNATHQVIVGGTNGLVFTPSQITAAVGDIVTFEFQTVNHTVTQSGFADPCALLTNTTTNQVGFDSGFVPVDSAATEFPAWSIQVTDAAAPIWFYCKQTGHCQKGMVGAINAPTSGPKTFSAFQALAMGSNSTTSTTGTTTSGSGIGASASGSVSDPAATGSSTGAAGNLRVSHAGMALGVIAAGVFLLA